MKIVNWNIEWMNHWFESGSSPKMRTQYLDKYGNIAITNVPELANRVSLTIKKMNPDILAIQEGPSDLSEMEVFVETFLNEPSANYEIIRGLDGSSQKLYFLIKNSDILEDIKIYSEEDLNALYDPWRVDIDGDLVLQDYKFTRMPLVIEGKSPALNNERITLIALHTKSKYVHLGKQLWENPDTRNEFIKEALINRRRISAEAMRLRRYMNDLLNNNINENIIVLGDFNDGPGFDYFEERYITHNVTDILLGSSFYPELVFHHSFLHSIKQDELYTAIFNDYVDDIQNRKLLLDHILVSPSLKDKVISAGIEHASFLEQKDDNATTEREKYPSDHRPVYISFV